MVADHQGGKHQVRMTRTARTNYDYKPYALAAIGALTLRVRSRL
jgi:hypothetical protein